MDFFLFWLSVSCYVIALIDFQTEVSHSKIVMLTITDNNYASDKLGAT